MKDEKPWSGMTEEEWEAERERIKAIQEKKRAEEKEMVGNG